MIQIEDSYRISELCELGLVILLKSLNLVKDLQFNQLQAQLVSLNLERNQISSVRLATLAGLSSLYSLSLAGHWNHHVGDGFDFDFGFDQI